MCATHKTNVFYLFKIGYDVYLCYISNIILYIRLCFGVLRFGFSDEKNHFLLIGSLS